VDAPNDGTGPPPAALPPALAGVLAVACVLACGELIAGLFGAVASSVELLGDQSVDMAPAVVRDLASAVFGAADASALRQGGVALTLLVGGAVGIIARRHWMLGALCFVGWGLLEIALTLPSSSASPVLVAAALGAGVLLGLVVLRRLLSFGRRSDRPREPEPGRRLLITGGLSAGILLAAGAGRWLQGHGGIPITRAAVARTRAGQLVTAPFAVRAHPPPITVPRALARAHVTVADGTFTTRYTSDVATPDHTYDMRNGVFEGYFDHDARYEAGEFSGGSTVRQKNASMIRIGETNRPPGLVVVGGKAYGLQPQDLTWERMKNGQQVQNDVDSWIETGTPSDPYVHQTTNMDGDTFRCYPAEGSWVVVAGRRLRNTMDGMAIYGTNAAGDDGAGAVFYQDCWFDRVRDDGVESDDKNGVHLWDCMLTTYTLVSVSPGTEAPLGTTQSQHDVTVESCVVQLAPYPGGHKEHSTDVTHGTWFKTESNGPADGNGKAWGFAPRLCIRDSVLAAERFAESDRSMLPERVDIGGVGGRNDTYQNVTICWLGPGTYPGNVPRGCTLVTGGDARARITAAQADWRARHGVTDFDVVDVEKLLDPDPPTL
jgi:hypothetical protein